MGSNRGFKKNSVIVGSVYRPNTAPVTDLNRAIEIHLGILGRIRANSKLKNLNLYVAGDFNINLLNMLPIPLPVISLILQ